MRSAPSRPRLELLTAARMQAKSGTQVAGAISIGLVTGEAYFGPVGRGEQVAYAVLGPLVNRAARAEAVRTPARSWRTRRPVAGRIRPSPIAPWMARGRRPKRMK